jgi:hypothetical protein
MYRLTTMPALSPQKLRIRRAVVTSLLLRGFVTIALMVGAGIAMGQASAPKPKAASMKTLLSNGWRIVSHTTFQYMEDYVFQTNTGQTQKFAKPSATIHASFVIEKAGKFAMCWGTEAAGYDHPCRALN